MRRIFLFFGLFVFLSVFSQYGAFSVPLSGIVEQEHYIIFDKTNTIVDLVTGKPVSNATVSIPSKGIVVKTNNMGQFNLNAGLIAPSIMSVNAEGYKPFSLTITENKARGPLTIGISKESGKEIIIDAELRHLGDNIFSENSANAQDFKTASSGSFFHKEFYLDKANEKADIVLKVGSIIGIDTEIARKLNQGTARNGISTPTKIYINSQKVGELRINGDNQEIFIPNQVLKPNTSNQLVIETGQNLLSRKRTDYDDIEFINLIIEFK